MKRVVGLLCGITAGLLTTAALADHHHETVHGAWDLAIQAQRGEEPSWVKLFKEDDTAVVDFVGRVGGKNRASEVKVNGTTFQWKVGRDTYHAELADGKLKGHVVRGDDRLPLVGVRALRPTNVVGTWDVQIEFGDRVMDRQLTLEQNGYQVSGRYGGGQFPDREIQNPKLDHGRLTYTIHFENDQGDEFTIEYELNMKGDRFDGTVRVADRDWEGRVRGERRRKWAEPIELFNGKDLSNWDYQPHGGGNNWKVVDGVMVNERAGYNIFSKQKFKDYKLRVDVNVPPRGNSGIYLNGRYEVQVADSHGRGVSAGGMGAIYGRAIPTVEATKPGGEWQTFEITFVDFWATVKLNGKTIIDNVLIEGITGGALDSHESEPGPILFQGDHGPIQFRNVVITPVAR